MSQKKSQWILAETPEIPPGVDEHIPEILVRMMCQRGVEISAMKRFLQPRLQDLQDPFLLPDMQAAVDRILTAVEKNELVCVYGDYDVDGITSVTLLTRVLRAYGVNTRSFIPAGVQKATDLMKRH